MANNKQLICLMGREGAGKTLFGHYLSEHGFEKRALAAPVKDITSIIYGFDRQKLEGITVEDRQWREEYRDPIWNMTPRAAMEYIGTDLFREHMDDSIWIKILDRTVHSCDMVYTEDVRFENEFLYFRARGARFVLLFRDHADLAITEADMKSHPAKWKFLEILKKYPDDIELYHNTTIEKLRDHAEAMKHARHTAR